MLCGTAGARVSSTFPGFPKGACNRGWRCDGAQACSSGIPLADEAIVKYSGNGKEDRFPKY